MRTNLSRFLITACILPATAAFAPRSLASTPSHAQKPLSVLPEHVDAFSSAVDQWHLVMASSSSMLADAASITTDAADVATQDSGWWQSYLNIFKVTLELVHTTIDPPLRSVGITQTWGLSIAIFTASTYCNHNLLVNDFTCTTVLTKLRTPFCSGPYVAAALVCAAIQVYRIHEGTQAIHK